MEPGRSIRRLGFRRWHERQLIEGHVWLLTCLLCGFAMAAALEVADFKLHSLPTLAVAFLTGLLAWHALLRYAGLMRRAQHFASQSTCGGCDRYGSYEVLSDAPRLEVRCRHCGRQWRLH